ncbi:MAG: hypothetical protein F4Y03_06690 [Alphaproteobacteria bacterium]|nr:hypothetical protein [Alphaproteobacteria bacterium]
MKSDDAKHFNWLLFKTLISRWRKVFIHWDFAFAVIVAAVIGTVPNYEAADWPFQRLVWIEVTVAGALLGMILAGISILIAFMREDFMVYLYSVGLEDDTIDGMYEAIFPFWFMAWLVVIVIVSGILGLALFASACTLAQRIFLSWTTFFISWAVFGVIPVVVYLARIGKVRIDLHLADLLKRARETESGSAEE